MSKLEELIEELCPDGVELKKIDDCANYIQPSKYIVSDTNYVDEGTPVLTPGQSFILGYTTEEDGIFEASKENPVILFDDFTGSLQWVDFPFKVKSSACKIITAKNIVGIRYLYHLMANLNFRSDEHKRLWISIYSQFEVPIPPFPVQEEIVRILDNFTDLTAELQAELQARAKQYEYYRNELLRCNGVERKTLQDISNGITSGKNKEKLRDGLYPVYGSTGIIASTNSFAYNHTQILIARVGANAGYVHIAEGEYDVSDNTLILNLKEDVSLRYVYYQLTNMNLNQYAKGGGQPLVTAGQMKEIEIPIPSLKRQEEIVEVLDRFYNLCENITDGLPAEIDARQKQYEYYRNKLLTFKEIGA